MFYDKIASIARLTPETADTDKERYGAVGNYEAIDINIQPATAELTAVSDGVYGQTFRAFVAVSGIMVGDRVTVSGTGDVFTVKGVDDLFFSPIPHLELVLWKGNP